MFCGECGRSVSAPVVAAPLREQPPLPVRLDAQPLAPICAACGLVAHPDDLYCAECGAALTSQTRIIDRLPEGASSLPAIESPVVPQPPAHEIHPSPDDEGVRFVLQFSTGESYAVVGSGLAGRNPRAEPGEYVDHLVAIVDPGRSVSKTHFEFGQESGTFWFSDRHSGNGSVIREPGEQPRVCEPGLRYPLARGTRVDIGEQFFIVS